MARCSICLILALSLATAYAQVPQPTGYEVLTDQPNLFFHFSWPAIPGATEYKVYEAGGTYKTCPAATAATGWTLDTTVTTNFYDDYPLTKPFYELPVLPVGGWKNQRSWCYAFTSVVNGVESAKGIAVNPDNNLNPVNRADFWSIGVGGYLTLEYWTACKNGKKIVPFPYMNGEDVGHFYYENTAGQKYEIPSINLHNAYPHKSGDPVHSFNQEWEFKWPVLDTTGTFVIPIDPNGKYTYVVTTGDGATLTGDIFAPLPSGKTQDNAWYANVFINKLMDGAACPTGTKLNYNWYQPAERPLVLRNRGQ